MCLSTYITLYLRRNKFTISYPQTMVNYRYAIFAGHVKTNLYQNRFQGYYVGNLLMIHLGRASTLITFQLFTTVLHRNKVISYSKSKAHEAHRIAFSTVNALRLPRYNRDSYDCKRSYLTVFTRSATLTEGEYEIELKICEAKKQSTI